MADDLIVPIYIDTNTLLDLLASIEGGFSVVEKVTTKISKTSGTDQGLKGDAGTEFGIPNVLNLLKINLGYLGSWKKAKEETQQKEAERYHTYGSLLYRLRDYLEKESLIKRIGENSEGWQIIQPSDFVEIKGIFKPNPLANSLEIIDRLVGIYQVLSGLNTSTDQSNPKLTPDEKKKLKDQKDQEKVLLKQMEQLRNIVRGISTDIQAERTRAFVVDLNRTEDYKAVVLLFLDYLRDQTMTEISYKEYRLLGKVVRKIEAGSDEAIDLLLGTGMGGIGKSVIEQLIGGMSQIPNMNLPKVTTDIIGPALEIVPIAVFV